MTRDRTVLHNGGALSDRERLAVQLPAPIDGAAGLALDAAGRELFGQLTTQTTAALDVERLVDRLVAHALHLRSPGLVAQHRGDQLR